METLDDKDVNKSRQTVKRKVSRVHFIMGLLSLIFNAFVFLSICLAFALMFSQNSRLIVYSYQTSFYVQQFFILSSVLMGVIAAILIMRAKPYGTTLYGIANVLWIGLQVRFLLVDNQTYRITFIALPIIFMFIIFKTKRYRDNPNPLVNEEE